jgi:sialate O-acetylesterase
MPKLTLLNAALLMLSAASATLRAEVRLPKLLSDHAVLQREAPIHIWGWADPGESVSVTLHGQHRSAVADPLGHWEVYLAPEHAGGPYDLQVAGTNSITISDILIGDVWFASGQSNMEMPLNGFPNSAVLKNAAQEIANANHPEIRLLHIDQKASNYPLQDQPATWTQCTPETAASFSAVAYLFGRDIQEREHVPIGLIDSTWGGTPAEAWVSMDGISANASLMPVFSFWAKLADTQQDMPALHQKEQREDLAAKNANAPKPHHEWHPNLDSWAPAALFNGMVAPATPFTIKGVIWYQGETNSNNGRANMYENVFSTLISDWRREWQQGNFPFLFVQISSFKSDERETWGIVRDAQRRTLDLRNTAMAVSLDVGDPDNVHPSDKQTVAARLALAARSLAYGENIEYSGPLFREATVEGAGMRVWFDHTAGKLTSKEWSLPGFEIAGDDHRFVAATARIEGETVFVSSPLVSHPRFVRYAWANAPEATLFNAAGLPASTFTSEATPLTPCSQGCRN